MNEIKVTTELCKEDRYRLDLIIQLLGQTLTPSTAQTCVADAAEHPVTEPFPAPATPAPETPVEETEPPATPALAEKPAELAAPAAEPVKKSDVQAAIVRLVAMGKKAEARDVVKSYAASVSAIPEDVLAEVMDKLKTLEGTR